MKDISLVVKKIEAWIREHVHGAGAKGVVLGLSGGLDSAVVAALCKRALGEHVLAVVMPCHSTSEDVSHANLIVKSYNLAHYLVDLSNSFTVMVKEINGQLPNEQGSSEMALTNLKPRLRMATLYYYAAYYNYLVMGTGNKSEIAIGYFTKYGDGGADLEPIGHLLKEEVKEIAVYLGIPKLIIDKSPSAGLWEGQTDEKELGFSYTELDHYLKYGEATPKIKNKIEMLIKNSEHKRQMPPMPEMF